MSAVCIAELTTEASCESWKAPAGREGEAGAVSAHATRMTASKKSFAGGTVNREQTAVAVGTNQVPYFFIWAEPHGFEFALRCQAPPGRGRLRVH